MNNLYHKVAVASVGIALGFALGINKEAKAGTFNFTPVAEYSVNFGYYGQTSPPDDYGLLPVNKRPGFGETRAFYKFDLFNFFRTDPIINKITFRANGWTVRHGSFNLGILAFSIISGKDSSYYTETPLSDSFTTYGFETDGNGGRADVDFDVTDAANTFRYPFYGYYGDPPSFGVSIYGRGDYSEVKVGSATLEIITEPVPEPTTILGSAIGLCLGGWLKRKKSILQNKAKSQA